MQRLLRHLLLIVFSLSLPVTGLASVAAPRVCAMHNMQADMHNKMHAEMNSSDPCCPHQQTGHTQPTDHAKPDSPCKMGHQCTSGGMMWPSAIQQSALPALLQTSAFRPIAQPLLATSAPAAVWRPPQH